MLMLYDEVEKICASFLANVDCGNCKHKESTTCEYCTNCSTSPLLYAADYHHLHLLTKEIIKIVKENETSI